MLHKAKNTLVGVLSILFMTYAQAAEWVTFKTDGLTSMIDVASIKKYPGLVFAVTKVSITKDLDAYHQTFYTCGSKKLYYSAPTTGYPDSEERPKPTTVWPQESNDLKFSIQSYCRHSNNTKDDVELPIGITGDGTRFETLLAKETEFKGENVLAWTGTYSVTKSLAYRMKDRDKTPVYNHKVNLNEGYMVNHVAVNCTRKTLKLLESYKYNKNGTVISSITQPKEEMSTVPQSHGRHVADFLCSLGN